MHTPKGQRPRSLTKLANLLKAGGKIIISLKLGISAAGQKQREMHDISSQEIGRFAHALGLISKLEAQSAEDKVKHYGIYWQTS
jgi:hypothetical protein